MSAEQHASLNLAQLTKKAFKPSNSMVTIFKDGYDEGEHLKFGSSTLNYRNVSQIEAGMAAKETVANLKTKGRILADTAFNPS